MQYTAYRILLALFQLSEKIVISKTALWIPFKINNIKHSFRNGQSQILFRGFKWMLIRQPIRMHGGNTDL